MRKLPANFPAWRGSFATTVSSDDADFGVLLEPTDGTIEGGCNGTMRFYLRTAGLAAHSGRAWKGENAIHKLAGALRVLGRLRTANLRG